MAWQPLSGPHPNPNQTLMDVTGVEKDDEVWGNDVYEIYVRYEDESLGRKGACQLSIKRYDRLPVHDWRHFQQIKNEICGPEREAVEIYPAESRLMDTSNQYHLWVMPEGVGIPLGMDGGAVTTDEQTKAYNRANYEGFHKGRQRPWEPGLTTGRLPDTPYVPDEDYEQMIAAIKHVGSDS